MALINSRGQVIKDGWSYPDAEKIAEVRAQFIIPLDVLAALASDVIIEKPIGVYVSAGVTAEQIMPVLGRIDLIVIEFQKFRDGRGFTVARMLRERHGFEGDVRAIGHVLPDQFAALVQCGFSTIVTPAEHPPQQWLLGAPAASKSSNAGLLLQRLIGQRGVSAVDVDAQSFHQNEHK
jgi:uncharacterized protein (DUF934 family)